MSHSLVVVESPTKVKTIKKFLGKDFNVVASVGHIKDLPKKTLGIDLEKDFEPTYVNIDSKKKTIDELKKAAQNAENIYLAPDPDREGEAIAWHISEVINTKNKTIDDFKGCSGAPIVNTNNELVSIVTDIAFATNGNIFAIDSIIVSIYYFYIFK